MAGVVIGSHHSGARGPISPPVGAGLKPAPTDIVARDVVAVEPTRLKHPLVAAEALAQCKFHVALEPRPGGARFPEPTRQHDFAATGRGNVEIVWHISRAPSSGSPSARS